MAMNETLSLLARLNTDLGHGWGLQGGSHLQQPQVAATPAAAAAAAAAAATPAAATPAAAWDSVGLPAQLQHPCPVGPPQVFAPAAWHSVGLPAPEQKSPWGNVPDQGVWASSSSQSFDSRQQWQHPETGRMAAAPVPLPKQKHAEVPRPWKQEQEMAPPPRAATKAIASAPPQAWADPMRLQPKTPPNPPPAWTQKQPQSPPPQMKSVPPVPPPPPPAKPRPQKLMTSSAKYVKTMWIPQTSTTQRHRTPRGGKRHYWESARIAAQDKGPQALAKFMRSHPRPENHQEDEEFRRNNRW